MMEQQQLIHSRGRNIVLMVLFSLLFCCFSSAHEHCCNKHKHHHDDGSAASTEHHHQDEYINDPLDLQPPDEYLGQRRLIPDSNSVMPSDWDEEDDGEWEIKMVENPEYTWKPRMIRNPHYNETPPSNSSYWKKLLAEIMETVPWVTLGVILTASLEMLQLPLDSLRGYLQSDSSSSRVLSFVKASLLGLATPLCSCGALPIASGFVANGVPLASALSFLTASQSAGLDSAAITWGLLGPMAALARLGGAVVLAVAAGMALGRKEMVAPNTTAMTSTGGTCHDDAKANNNRKNSTSYEAPKLVATLVDTAMDIFPMVLVGLAISTAVVHSLPSLSILYNKMLRDDIHEQQTILGPFLVRMLVLLSALPLQLCEHTTVTIAAGIQQAGGSAGLAFAFLLSAPATNLPSLLLLLRTSSSLQRDRSFAAVARVGCALIGVALLLSYLVDFAGVDMLVEKEAATTNENASSMGVVSLPAWYVASSPWIASGLLVAGVASKCVASLSKNKEEEEGTCCANDKKQN